MSSKAAEKKYLDNLFAHVSHDNVRNAYVEPVLARLIKNATPLRPRLPGEPYEVIPYDIPFSALKRAAREVANNWKLEHVMTVGLSKSAQNRQIENLARSFMEIYFARLGAQRRQ